MVKNIFFIQTFFYFIVLQCFCGALPVKNLASENPSAKNSKPITDIINEEEVEGQAGPFYTLLDKLITSVRNCDLKNVDKLQGELMGNIKQVIRRAIKVDQLLKKEAKLEYEKDRADMFQLILALTNRVDTMETLLLPGNDFRAGQTRKGRWLQIFKLKTPAVEDIRKKVRAAGMTEFSFADQLDRLIQERTNRVGHIRVPLPKLIKQKTIEGAVQLMEISDDKKAIETLKIIVEPLNGVDFSTTVFS